MDEFNEDQLHEYLDGTLNDEARRAVETHLASSPEARAQLAALEGLFASLDGLPELPLPTDLSDEVVAQIQRETARPLEGAGAVSPSLPRWLWALLLGQIAVALLLFGNRWSVLLDGLANGRQLATDWFSTVQLPSLTFFEQLWVDLASLLQTPTLPNFSIDLPTSQWGLLFGLALLIWLAGNRLLFTTE